MTSRVDDSESVLNVAVLLVLLEGLLDWEWRGRDSSFNLEFELVSVGTSD